MKSEDELQKTITALESKVNKIVKILCNQTLGKDDIYSVAETYALLLELIEMENKGEECQQKT